MSAAALACELPVRATPRAAVAVSLALHAAALLLLPGLAQRRQEPPILVATLRFPAPAPAAEAAPAKPAPVAPPPHRAEAAPPPRAAAPLRPPPQRPAPAPTAAAPLPAPAAVPLAAAAQAAPPATPPIAAAPAEAPAAPADGAALDDYGRALSDLLARQQQYPRLAALRGWEGEVRLRIKVARKGNLVAVQVVRSSGHEVLDQSAVQMVQGATLPSLPAGIGEGEIQVVVPIHYKLQKPT